MYPDDELYFSLNHRRPLFEAEDDDNGAADQGGDAAPANNTEAPAEDNNQEEAPAENEDNAEEAPNDNNDEEAEEDFEINGEGDEEGGDEEGNDEGGDEEETTTEEPGEVSLGDNPDYTNANIEKEKEIYDTLSPEEQQMKDKNLRKLYADLYTNINQIIDKLDSISIEMEDVNTQAKRLIMILYEYKQLIHDYFSNLYNSKSYIENLQNFEKYKLFLFGIQNIINTLNSISDKEND